MELHPSLPIDIDPLRTEAVDFSSDESDESYVDDDGGSYTEDDDDTADSLSGNERRSDE